MFELEFIAYIGKLKNDTGIDADIFLLKMVFENTVEDVILTIHESIEYVTTENDYDDETLSLILNEIYKKYNKEELLKLCK